MTPKSLKIATYNVHGWFDGEGKHNLERVIQLYSEEKPDILCLQETTKFQPVRDILPSFIQEITRYGLNEFREKAGLKNCVAWSSTAILSNLKIQPMEKEAHPRFVTCLVQPDNNMPAFHLTCLHLDHRVEPARMNEIRKIEARLKPLFDAQAAQIWTGDYNSLTKEDYSEAEWEAVAEVRKRNSWEPPKTIVTSYMKLMGFKDAWTMAGRPGAISTCRFNTHIDYVFLNKEMETLYELETVLHHPNQLLTILW